MAYAQGDVILRDHYNTFATGSASGSANHAVANINTVWGVGNGSYGYGQSTTLSAVAAGDTVTATQWATMIARLDTMKTHRTGSGTGLTSPTAGDIITYLSALSGHVDSAYNNRSSFTARSSVTSDSTRNGTWTSSAPTTFTQVRTVTFQDADKMRYFFNGGGRLTLKLAATGAAGTTKETNWVNLINNGVGSVNLDFTTSARTGSQETLTNNGSATGFWDLTGSNQTLVRVTQDTAPYTGSYVDVFASVSGAAGSNGGLGTAIAFTVVYTDDGSSTFNDNISLTINCNVDIYKPEVTNLSDVWGTITVASTTN